MTFRGQDLSPVQTNYIRVVKWECPKDDTDLATVASKEAGRRDGRGFTLIELLVVITIISILLAVGGSFFRDTGRSALTLQVATLPSLFDSARLLAVSRSTKARVLFQNDSTDAERFRRWVSIMVQNGVDAAGAPVWQAEGPPVLFRSGIFYFPVKAPTGTTSVPLTVKAQVAGKESQCAAYEYDETGLTLQTSPPVMLVRGFVDGTRVVVKRQEERDGFYLRQYGGVTRVDRPDQLPAPLE